MKFIISIIIFVSTSVMANNISTGQQIFEKSCQNCHGVNANKLATPVLHGQIETYLVSQLESFKSGSRIDLLMGKVMNDVAKELSHEEIKSVSAYLASLNPCDYPVTIETLGANLTKGKRAARSCKSCHKKEGNTLNAPIIKRQKTAYLIHSLNAFAAKTRKNSYMQGQAKLLDRTHNVGNVAAYMNAQDFCVVK
ncbi:MAG: c-type cytochrome [Halobacteriovoraceae bacterium]|jgi:cytochrome c553|nr:c-type cytochrome [Halobacteriovoraceae bacterium]